jgi:hypothetical protein
MTAAEPLSRFIVQAGHRYRIVALHPCTRKDGAPFTVTSSRNLAPYLTRTCARHRRGGGRHG